MPPNRPKDGVPPESALALRSGQPSSSANPSHGQANTPEVAAKKLRSTLPVQAITQGFAEGDTITFNDDGTVLTTAHAADGTYQVATKEKNTLEKRKIAKPGGKEDTLVYAPGGSTTAQQRRTLMMDLLESLA